ncbi:MAG: hypothetical protein JXQ73_22240 [Phycisphaerae bacterium]|nr:hypothetical protein [Phycisphaerae bacterium]
MDSALLLRILPQPNDSTCGPTCLHAIYRYYGEDIALEQVIAEVPQLADGGTLEVLLGCHALRRGYRATIYTYNLQMFDPTWFGPGSIDLGAKLTAQLKIKHSERRRLATKGYLEFLDRGGRIRFEDLTTRLLRKYLRRSVPIVTGLSATYLHRTAREHGPGGEVDDVRGQPVGHFVVLCGLDRDKGEVLVADPLQPNPIGASHVYSVGIDRVVGAVLLGVLTHDANLLIIERGQRG